MIDVPEESLEEPEVIEEEQEQSAGFATPGMCGWQGVNQFRAVKYRETFFNAIIFHKNNHKTLYGQDNFAGLVVNYGISNSIVLEIP